MCEEKPIEEQVIEVMKLQCKLIDDVRREIEKPRKTIKGERNPMASQSREVRDLLGRRNPEPDIPLDDRL